MDDSTTPKEKITKEETKLRRSLPNPYDYGLIENLKHFWFPNLVPKSLPSAWSSALAEYQAQTTVQKKEK
jgi:hypothetical protein